MRSAFQCGLFLSFVYVMAGFPALADEDLFEGNANPTPVFASDHPYDDSDMDRTGQKFKKKSDDDDQDFLAKDEDYSDDDDSDDIDDQDKTLKQNQGLSVLKKDKEDQEKNPDSSDTTDDGL